MSFFHQSDAADLLFSANPLPMWVCDTATAQFLAVNDTTMVLYGYTRDEFLGMTLAGVQSAGDVSALEHQACFSGVWQHSKKDGAVLWVSLTSHDLLFAGRPARLIVVQDMTERRQAEDALRQAEEKFRSIFENAVEGIFQTTPDGRYQSANPALARIYGYESPADLIASLTDIGHQLYVDSEDRGRFARLMQQQDSVSAFEARIRRKDGAVIWISEHARAVRDESGSLLYYEGTVQEISERKALEMERERLLQEAVDRADRDPLTGLWNHRVFHMRLEEEVDRAQQTGQPLAVAVLDLDNFKFFNDAYGHSAGDDVLRQVALAVQRCCRPGDTLARFGGDEFALLMPGTGAARAGRVAERLDGSLGSMGYRPPDHDTAIPLGLTVGLAVFPDDGATRLDVLSVADNRLRRAKSGGGDDEEAASLRHVLSQSKSGFSILDALVTAVDTKDRYTRRHSEDVMTYCAQIAAQLGVDPDFAHTLKVAALLHDVGKVGVPDRILRKPGRLTDEEFAAIQQHPTMGSIIVGAVPGFEQTLEAIRHHHERWDGTGYPAGLQGKQIPLAARIMAIADAYSAMTTDRPYRKGLRAEQALAELAEGVGVQWDPVCVHAFQRAWRAHHDRCFADPRPASALAA